MAIKRKTAKRKTSSARKPKDFVTELKKMLAKDVEPSSIVALVALAIAFVVLWATRDIHQNLETQKSLRPVSADSRPLVPLTVRKSSGGGCVHTQQ